MQKTKTKIWPVDPRAISREALGPAASVLRSGGLVAFPTETVYGLGADALNDEAVARIFVAKGRPADNPLIVHVASLDMAMALVASRTQEEVIRQLGEAFWPGPLTLVASRNARVGDAVTAGLDTVGLRVPAHPVALELIDLVDRPLAAPSANRSGRPSPTRASHVMADLNGRIEGIIDGGSSAVGLESTVLDVTAWPPVLLRPGGVTPDALKEVLGTPVVIDAHLRAATNRVVSGPVRSPGMKYTHYAPSTPLLLIEGTVDPESLGKIANEQAEQGKRVGLLVSQEIADAALGFPTVTFGARDNPEQIAAGLFDALRKIDELDCDLVIVEGIEATGVGFAVMNRLRRAASASRSI